MGTGICAEARKAILRAAVRAFGSSWAYVLKLRLSTIKFEYNNRTSSGGLFSIGWHNLEFMRCPRRGARVRMLVCWSGGTITNRIVHWKCRRVLCLPIWEENLLMGANTAHERSGAPVSRGLRRSLCYV